MQPLNNIQKFADTPISNAAMNDLTRVRIPQGPASFDMPFDITSPEGIIAFFQQRISDTNADLRKSIDAQKTRSEVSKQITAMNGILAKYDGDNTMTAGSPDFVEFQRLVNEIAPSLGTSADAESIKSALQAASAPSDVTTWIKGEEPTARAAFQKAHPGAEIYPPQTPPQNPSLTDWKFVTHDGPGVNGATCKQLSTQLKGVADEFTSNNSLDAINVQEYVNRISQMTSLASNIVHSYDERAMAPIQNIK
jgi:hypothetical protein